VAVPEPLGALRVPAPQEASIVPVFEPRPPRPRAWVDLEPGPHGQGEEDRRGGVGDRARVRWPVTGPGGEGREVGPALAPAGGLPAVGGELPDALVHEVEDSDEVAGPHDAPVGEGDGAPAMAAELEAEDAGRADRPDLVAAPVEALPGGEDRVEDRGRGRTWGRARSAARARFGSAVRPVRPVPRRVGSEAGRQLDVRRRITERVARRIGGGARPRIGPGSGRQPPFRRRIAQRIGGARPRVGGHPVMMADLVGAGSPSPSISTIEEALSWATMEGGSTGLVVAVHDIAPSTLPEVRWLLARLDELGIVPRVLKVIPRASEADDVRRHPELLAVLAADVEQGSEVVVHGLTHRLAPGAIVGGRPLDRLRARLFAGSAAEFLGLDDEAAAAAVVEARATVEGAGFDPVGFCAPGWLARPSLSAILRRCGFRYACWFGSVEDLRTGERLRAPAWGYMGTGGPTETLVGLEGWLVRTVWRRLLPGPVRIFLHPQGAPRSAACAATLRAIGRLRPSLRPTTYRELLDGRRD